jgi:Flp pilus assembly protein TadB
VSLESAEWHQRGPPRVRPNRPPTVGDRIARAVAFLLLIVIFAFSAFALSLVQFGINIVVAALVVAGVFLFFRVRDLSRRLEEQRQELEAMRAAARPPTPPSEPVP